MNLEELLADAMRLSKKPKVRKAKAKSPTDDYSQTKAELRAMQLERCVPESIHLRVTYQTCECGSTYESVNCVPLVKCVSPSITHFRPEPDISPTYDHLPRITEAVRVEIPWCEDCFANSRLVEVPAPTEEEKNAFRL